MTTENPILKAKLAMVQRAAQDLVAWARSLGTTVTIDTVPGKPLAMWNHEMRADAREARRPLGSTATGEQDSAPELPARGCGCAVAEHQKLVNGIPPAMVYAFHRTMSDSDLEPGGFEEIRAGLAAAFSYLLTPQTNPGVPTWTLGDIEDGWRDLDHMAHRGFAKVAWRMEDDERSPENEARALAMVAALNFAEGLGKPVAEICSASGDDAQFGERAITPLVDLDVFEYGTQLYAVPAYGSVSG